MAALHSSPTTSHTFVTCFKNVSNRAGAVHTPRAIVTYSQMFDFGRLCSCEWNDTGFETDQRDALLQQFSVVNQGRH